MTEQHLDLCMIFVRVCTFDAAFWFVLLLSVYICAYLNKVGRGGVGRVQQADRLVSLSLLYV